MPESRNIFAVQPGSDRRMLGEMSPLERLQWDLAVPDSAPDEHQRAAARRISNALGVPDTSGDGYAWQKGKAGFATGREYLTTMQGIFKDGDIFSATASEELKAFEAADREGRLKLARKAQGWIDAAAHWGATPWRRGYGLAEGHELLAGAPADVVAANARLREDEEARRAYNRAQSASSEPYQERRGADEAAADREALDRWHQQRDEDALMGDYGERLFNEHYNLVWLTMTRGLSPAAREIAEGALKERRLQEDDIARFKGLDEKEQAIVARLIRLSRQRVEGGFWNTLGDMGIEFINGAVRLPANVFKQAGTTTEELTWHFFGDDALLVDPEYKNQQARIEQRLYEALGDYPGLDPSGAEHGYAARSFIGAVSTLPYMGYAAMPGIGLAVVAMDMMQRLDERIAAEGGDPYGKGLEWQAYKAFAGGLYAITERLQVERLMGANSDFAYRAALVRMFTRHGAGVAKKVAGRIALDTAIESLQEGLQEAIEEHGVSMGLTGQPGWRRAVEAGVREFGETLGTMGILALGGAGWQAYKQRRPAGKRALAAEARDIYLRNSFLVHDNPYHQQGDADATVGVMARVVRQIDEYRAVWQEEGEAGLARRGDVGAEGAALLNTVFEAEVAEREAMSYIIGRNIVERSRAEADEAGLPYFEHDHARVAEIVAAHGAGAAAALERIGYTQAGAARLVEYFREADKGRAAAQQVAQQVQTRLAAEWARDPAAREALQAQGIAELGELEGLRSLYQQAGTRQGAQRAFDELGLGIAESEKSKTTLSERLVSLFEAEHELATSPAAAAAFRERYMAESRDMALAERVARLSGFEAEAEPEAGPGAYRLTRRDENGQVLGEVVLRQVAEDEIDIEGMYSGEAVEAATRGRAYAVTAAEWEAMGQAEREAYAREHLRVQGGWRMTSARNEAVEATGEQARILTGEIILAEGARSATLYHEAVHAWAAMMREAGMLSEADIKKLQDKYGVAADDAGWFNEEALAEDMREIGAATDFVPEKGLASRFKAAVRRLLRTAEAAEQQAVAAEGARRALFEQIVYGGAWQGVGDFAPAAQQAGSREPGTGDPLAAVNRKPGAQEAEAGTGEQEAGTGEQEAGTGEQEAGTSVNAGAATGLEDGEAGEQPPPPAARRKGGKQFWSAATPRGNVRVGGYWAVVPRSRVISDTDRERYDFALQERRRDATVGSNAQVQQIATEGVFDPLRLLDAPDTAGGAPIVVPVQMKNEQGKDETYYMVVSGNGRQRVLDLVEADNRGDTYRNPVREFADEHGIKYDPALMTAAAQPRLVRVMNRKPVGVTVKQVAELSNKNVILQMSPAEQASSDAELIRQHDKAGLFNANRDGMPGKTASAEFLAWFVEAAGDESLMDSKGQPTDVARERARRAMLALVIGQGAAGKATVAAFTEQAETLGLQRQHDALLMASGAISALGELKPEYALAEELSRAAAAMLEIAEERKRGKVSDADSHIAQGDMLDALSPAAEQLLRLLDSKRSAEWMAEAMRRYVELASNIDTTTGDMFGAVNATKAELLERAIRETEPGQGVADMRYSIAARRHALRTGMEIGGADEALFASQLEFAMYRMDEGAAQAPSGRRPERYTPGQKAVLAEAFRNPYSAEAWTQAFGVARNNTVSRLLHDYYMHQGQPRANDVFYDRGWNIYQMHVRDPIDMAALLLPLRNPYQESIKMLLLDERSRLIEAIISTVGLLDASMAHPRETFNRAVRVGAQSVVLAHNHPSGDPSPSQEDVALTQRMEAAGKILGIEIKDHIITNGQRVYSIRQRQEYNVDAALQPWEVLDASREAPQINGVKDIGSVASALRADGRGYAHVIVVDTQRRITAVRRVAIDKRQPGAQQREALVNEAARTAFANAGAGVFLDLSGVELGVSERIPLKMARMKESFELLGLNLLDTLYAQGGWIWTEARGYQIMPLTQEALQQQAHPTGQAVEYEQGNLFDGVAEGDIRYSLAGRSAATAGAARAAEEYRAVEAAWRNADGSYKDGWMRAPNGEVTRLNERQWVQVRTPSFKAWFGDWENDPENASKVVDGNGEPLVVYHGSMAREDFSEFDPDKGGTNFGREEYDRGYMFFTSYADNADPMGFDSCHNVGAPRIYPVFLNIRNALELNAPQREGAPWNKMFWFQPSVYWDENVTRFTDEMCSEDNDGAIVKGENYDGHPESMFVVMSSNQIKSAIGNTGAFSVADGDIRYSLAAARRDAAYMAAVERGDMAAAQEMVDAAIRRTDYEGWGRLRTRGEPSDMREDWLERLEAGQRLKQETGRNASFNMDGTVILFHGSSPENIASIRQTGLNRQSFLAGRKQDVTEHIRQHAETEIVRIVADARDVEYSSGSNEFYAPDGLFAGEDGVWSAPKRAGESGRVKLSAPVTYDDEGMVIPLSQRFDRSNNDIRYSLAARDAERLFDLSKAPADSVRLIPLGQVRVVRQESDKRVANAMRYMQMALDGKGERRAPVQAVDNGDGTVTIVDGTATVRAAERMGVPAVYAEVKPRIPGSFTANSALFVEPQVMAEGKRFGSLDALYEAAHEAAPEFARKLEAVAEAQGFGLKMRKEIKLRGRVERKLAGDYGGNVNKLLDMVAGTLILQEGQRFGDAVKALQKGGFEIARVKNDFLKKRVGNGYKDIKVNVRLPNGLVAEVILIEQEMLDKKRAMGHKIYKELRVVEDVLKQAFIKGDADVYTKLDGLLDVMEQVSALYYGAIEGDYDALAADFGAASAAISSTTSQASSSLLSRIMSYSLPAQNILPGVLTRFPSMISSLKRLSPSTGNSSETTSVSRFKKNIGTPLSNEHKTILNDSDGNVNSDIRYALDTRGQAYPKDNVLTALMATAIMSGQAVPSRNTMEMVADSIGAAGFKYEQAARAARRLAEETTDTAIKRAAMSSDPQAAAFAVGELARQAARALVREGARAGLELGRAREKIGRMSEAVRTRMMQELTGADAAAMETDIDADLAATILAADPATFAPDERPVKVALAEGGTLELEQGAAELDAVDDAGGADAPQMTDKQRAELARKRRQREERIQQMLDAARQRGEWQRQRQAERKARAEAEAAAGDEAGADGGAGGEGAAAGVQADALLAGEKVALNLGDKWEVAALMRLWAFDRWKRENPLRNSKGDANRDKLAVEFYRKTAVRTLTDLARKLLEPGFPRETVLRQINDITQGLHAGVIERRSAHVLGTINRHAIRAERKTLVQKFRAEMKRQFVKGLHFQELGLDLDRTLRGAVEEDARYVIRVCELSSEVYRGDTSALAREHQRLELIIADRMGMTDEQGRRLDVGDSDMQLQRALRQLALLDKYGGMVSMMPGEILDLQAEAMSSFAQEAVALQERWQRYDEVITQIREPLVAAIMREVDAPLLDDSSALGRLTDSLMGMLRMRLDYLTRFEGDPAKREAAREAIGEIMDMLARGGREYTIATQDDRAALMQTLREIHKRPDGKPDMQAVRNYLRSLDEKIPLELAQQLTKRGRIGKQQGMTKGQMMQLLVYLDQWASYGDNIRKHGRVGQATLIRTYMHEDPRTGELQPVLTGADRQVIEWLRQQFYAGRREAISAVTERVAGRAVASPDPLYMPVRMQREGRKGLADMYGGAWQPLSGVFSRRVRHGLDVDESASILDMFHNRSHETALLRAYTERGLMIRDILTHQAFQDAVRRFHGERQLREILSQVTQSLNAGKKPGEYRDPSANLAMRVMTYTALGWNTLTPMKQTTSMIVWANRIGFKDFFRHLVNVDRQALRELLARPEARVRWGIQMGSGMSPAEQAAYDAPESSVAKKIFGDWGLIMNREADKLVSLWIGQGVYRDLAAQYMDQGMSEEAAKDRAASEMFSMVEETQSSTRAENLPQLRREGGGLGRLVTQFAITPLLQIQYEIGAFREWRDLVRHGGTEANIREARNKYMRATVINHVIVPAAILLATNLHKLLTGDEPDWEKDGYWKTVLVAVLIGQFSRVFFLGALTESMLTAVFERKAPRSGQLIPAEGVISLGVNMVYPVRDIVLWEMDDLERDLIRAAKSTAVTRLPAKLYERSKAASR